LVTIIVEEPDITSPPQTIIRVPVQTTDADPRPAGAPVSLVGTQDVSIPDGPMRT
jgi:hypothetical protein